MLSTYSVGVSVCLTRAPVRSGRWRRHRLRGAAAAAAERAPARHARAPARPVRARQARHAEDAKGDLQ